MDIIETIKQIQRETPYFPTVALYVQIARKHPRVNVQNLLNEAIRERKLIWGKTPFTYWFATELSAADREVIADKKRGWTIEQDILQNQ